MDGEKTNIKGSPRSSLPGIRKKDQCNSGTNSPKKVVILAPGLETIKDFPTSRHPPQKKYVASEGL